MEQFLCWRWGERISRGKENFFGTDFQPLAPPLKSWKPTNVGLFVPKTHQMAIQQAVRWCNFLCVGVDVPRVPHMKILRHFFGANF